MPPPKGMDQEAALGQLIIADMTCLGFMNVLPRALRAMRMRRWCAGDGTGPAWAILRASSVSREGRAARSSSVSSFSKSSWSPTKRRKLMGRGLRVRDQQPNTEETWEREISTSYHMEPKARARMPAWHVRKALRTPHVSRKVVRPPVTGPIELGRSGCKEMTPWESMEARRWWRLRRRDWGRAGAARSIRRGAGSPRMATE